MGCKSVKLPIIDLSDLKHGSEKWESTKMKVRQACEEFGCFEAKFNEIPLHLRQSAIDETIQLFDLPLPTKLLNVTNKPYHGYIGQSGHVPLFESLGVDDVLSPPKLDAFTHLMWPQGKPSFSKIMGSFSERVSELDKMVRKMVVESLGLEKYMDEHMDSANYRLRVQKYDKPANNNETELGLNSHTDKNFITILYQNQINGLQVQTKDDGHWIHVHPSLNSFVVTVGESFHAWTNGRLHAAYHRVMMAGDEARYSIGLFSITKPGYMIKAPEEMVDEEHPLLFKPFDHHQFLDFFYTEAGLKSPDALKEYCGV